MEKLKLSHVIYGGKKYSAGVMGVPNVCRDPRPLGCEFPISLADDGAVLGADCAIIGSLAVTLACAPEWDKTGHRKFCVNFAGEDFVRRAEAMAAHLQVVYVGANE